MILDLSHYLFSLSKGFSRLTIPYYLISSTTCQGFSFTDCTFFILACQRIVSVGYMTGDLNVRVNIAGVSNLTG